LSSNRRGSKHSVFSRAAAPAVARRQSGYTLLFLSGENGSPLRLRVPRAVAVFLFCAFFCLLGGLSALVIDYSRMQRVWSDNEKLRAENHSIRSEAAAIIARLEGVQSALNRMDDFSSQIREMAKPEVSCKGARCKKTSQSPAPNVIPQGSLDVSKPDSIRGGGVLKTSVEGGVGPISREDYSILKGMKARGFGSAVNTQNLEFREAFVRLEAIGRRSETKAHELERLLGDVAVYNRRIATTPTLAPAQGYLSSSFGRRTSPVSGVEQMHWGLDIAASVGAPVYVAAAGTVVGAKWVEDYGKVIDVDHGNGIRTRYAHLNRILTRVGEKVVKGSVIGEVGDTGRSTGPHLHYEVEKDGRRVNPIRYIHDW
jgi:murein DD-endopeptidase MepM/ murein hydrolase activator NlpD